MIAATEFYQDKNATERGISTATDRSNRILPGFERDLPRQQN
jgi:hypothetical protein